LSSRVFKIVKNFNPLFSKNAHQRFFYFSTTFNQVSYRELEQIFFHEKCGEIDIRNQAFCVVNVAFLSTLQAFYPVFIYFFKFGVYVNASRVL
jgi:hypothetical protein